MSSLTQHFNRVSERDKRKTVRNKATAAEQMLWYRRRSGIH